jgi:hypothetical protein
MSCIVCSFKIFLYSIVDISLLRSKIGLPKQMTSKYFSIDSGSSCSFVDVVLVAYGLYLLGPGFFGSSMYEHGLFLCLHSLHVGNSLSHRLCECLHLLHECGDKYSSDMLLFVWRAWLYASKYFALRSQASGNPDADFNKSYFRIQISALT